MNFEEIYKRVEFLDGWMPKEDCEALYTVASQVEGIIVEIGPWQGKSTNVLCLSSPKSQVHSFDNFTNDYSYMGGVVTGKKAKERCIKNTKGLKNLTLHFEDSVSGSRTWKAPVDLLVIDGDHQALSVKLDIAAWVPHVRPECKIMFHDYYDAVHNVKEGVDALSNLFYDFTPAYKQVFDEESGLMVDVFSGFLICKKK